MNVSYPRLSSSVSSAMCETSVSAPGITTNQRNQNILTTLRAANHLFNQWEEDAEAGEIQHLYMDHDSELYDHWENIREAERWFTKAETMTTSAAPEFYQLSVLREMQSEVKWGFRLVEWECLVGTLPCDCGGAGLGVGAGSLPCGWVGAGLGAGVGWVYPCGPASLARP